MNERVVRVLNAYNARAAQNHVVWSYARKRFMPVEVSYSTTFHVEIDGCFEQKTPENSKQEKLERSLNKYSQGTQAQMPYTRQLLIQRADNESVISTGYVSRSVLYDYYRADRMKKRGQQQSPLLVDQSLERALQIADKLQAFSSGERVVLSYYKWVGDIADPFHFLYSVRNAHRPVSRVAFHPRHEEVFAVCYGSKNTAADGDGAKCDIFSLSNIFAPILTIPLLFEATAVAWSNTNKRELIVGLINGYVVLYNLDSGAVPLSFYQAHQDFITSLYFQSNKPQFVCTSISGACSVFEIVQDQIKLLSERQMYASTKVVDSYADDKGKTMRIVSADLSQERLTPYLLALGGEDGSVKVISTMLQYMTLRVLLSHEMAVYSLSINKFDQNLLASASEDYSVNIWYETSEQPIVKLAYESVPVFVQFCPHRSTVLLVALFDGSIFIYDLLHSTTDPYVEFKARMAEVACAAINKYGRLLVLGGVSGEIQVCQLFDILQQALADTPANQTALQSESSRLEQFVRPYR